MKPGDKLICIKSFIGKPIPRNGWIIHYFGNRFDTNKEYTLFSIKFGSGKSGVVIGETLDSAIFIEMEVFRKHFILRDE